MLVYLDNGIIVSIEEGELMLEDILAKIGRTKGNVYLPFTAAHIQEANNITHPDESERQRFIQNRLQLIRQISDGYYLNFVMKVGEIRWFVEEPTEVLATISEVPLGENAMRMFVNLFSKDQKDQFRMSLGIDPKEINNYKPDKVLNHLNTKLASLGAQSFVELVEYGMRPNQTSILGHRFLVAEKIAAIFELLDMLGYWKDKHTTTSNYARFWDSNHVSYATVCDYFICDDFRTRRKTQVVYDLLNVKTKIVNSGGLP